MLKNKNHSSPRFRDKWAISIGFLVILVSVFHYSTSTHLSHWHEVYGVLYYLPIILAAFRYQLRGGLIVASVITIIYLPHVMFQWGGDFLFNLSRFLEIVMYLVVGWVAGLLAQREWAERKKYQTAAQSLEQSYRQLREQTEKLSEIEEQLRFSERLSVLGELAANLAHEVRNPLGSIRGVAEILKDECIQAGKDNEFAQILLKEVKRLDEVVENYLNLARKPTPSLQTCNLYEIAQSVIALLNNKARKESINLRAEFPEDSILVKANEIQLRQILINIILNSMAAIETAGSITIRATLKNEPPYPTEPVEEISPSDKVGTGASNLVHLSITDTGHGIPEEMVKNIFKPFYTTKQNGTGLGLSIAKRIADQHKWKIDIKSQQGVGTTFTIIMPVEEPHVSQAH